MIREMVVDVNIDTFDVLCQLSKNWRVSIGVDASSPIMGGYWMRCLEIVEGDNKEEFKYVRIRLATHDEIIRMDAFNNIIDYTSYLF